MDDREEFEPEQSSEITIKETDTYKYGRKITIIKKAKNVYTVEITTGVNMYESAANILKPIAKNLALGMYIDKNEVAIKENHARKSFTLIGDINCIKNVLLHNDFISKKTRDEIDSNLGNLSITSSADEITSIHSCCRIL